MYYNRTGTASVRLVYFSVINQQKNNNYSERKILDVFSTSTESGIFHWWYKDHALFTIDSKKTQV